MQHSSSPEPWRPMALLLLVTGLPASGKSSFLAAVQQRAQLLDDGAGWRVPLFGGGLRGYIHRVLTLDEILADLEEAADVQRGGASPVDKREFSPSQWRQAARQLLELTRQALLVCSGGSADVAVSAPADVPMVFVEDNMHYRSMRERYYRVCRAVEAELHEASGPAAETGTATQRRRRPSPIIPLLELRFATPLHVCLARNAQRRHGATKGAGSQPSHPASRWVPPPVICSMAALFDHCYADSAREGSGVATAAWRWTRTTQPWGLLVHEFSECCTPALPSALSAMETAVGLFDVSLQLPDAWEACLQQRRDVTLARLRRLEAAPLDDGARAKQAAEAVQSHSHRLDLQLRAVVHAFLSDRHTPCGCGDVAVVPPPRTTAQFRKSVTAAKKEATLHFRARLRDLEAAAGGVSHSTAMESIDAAVGDLRETVLHRFQLSLLDLWRAREAGDGAAVSDDTCRL